MAANFLIQSKLKELTVKTKFHLTQADIRLVMSHVNSYTRKKLNDQSPYDAFSSRYGFKLINALGIEKINPNDIILKPFVFLLYFKSYCFNISAACAPAILPNVKPFNNAAPLPIYS